MTSTSPTQRLTGLVSQPLRSAYHCLIEYAKHGDRYPKLLQCSEISGERAMAMLKTCARSDVVILLPVAQSDFQGPTCCQEQAAAPWQVQMKDRGLKTSRRQSGLANLNGLGSVSLHLYINPGLTFAHAPSSYQLASCTSRSRQPRNNASLSKVSFKVWCLSLWDAHPTQDVLP
jgi:hypothetical protein